LKNPLKILAEEVSEDESIPSKFEDIRRNRIMVKSKNRYKPFNNLKIYDK
jgi:hypothetical protein